MVSKYNANEFIGKRFGKLVVIGLGEVWHGKKEDKKGQQLWKCLCDCGTEIQVPSKRLIGNIIKSCGCSRYRLGGDTAILKIFNNYRSDSIKLKREFNLTFEELKAIILQPCYYCDSPPYRRMKSNGFYKGKVKQIISYCGGVDRINPLKGYLLDNVVPCCKNCNMMKWVFSKEEFLKQVEKIFNHQKTINKKPRDDVDASECLMTQVKYKPEED